MKPHKKTMAQVQNTPGLLQNVAATRWPDAYYKHPVTQQALRDGRDPPLPLALYCDNVRYTSAIAGTADSLLGLWLVNVYTGKRHLIGTLRGREACRCGCKGFMELRNDDSNAGNSDRPTGEGQRNRSRGVCKRNRFPTGNLRNGIQRTNAFEYLTIIICKVFPRSTLKLPHGKHI